MRVALDCDVWMPRKNSSMVAQYVIDSLVVMHLGSGSYTSLISYMLMFSKSAHSVSARLL